MGTEKRETPLFFNTPGWMKVLVLAVIIIAILMPLVAAWGPIAQIIDSWRGAPTPPTHEVVFELVDRQLTFVGVLLAFIAVFMAAFTYYIESTRIAFKEGLQKLEEAKGLTSTAAQSVLLCGDLSLATLLPNPCKTQQIPLETTYTLSHFDRIVEGNREVKAQLDASGNGALIRLAQALYFYGRNGDDEKCLQLLEEALSPKVAKSRENTFKIWHRLGIALRQQQRLAEAADRFNLLQAEASKAGCFEKYERYAQAGKAITWLAVFQLLENDTIRKEIRANQWIAFNKLGLIQNLPDDIVAPANLSQVKGALLANAFDSFFAASHRRLFDKRDLLPTYYLVKTAYYLDLAKLNEVTAAAGIKISHVADCAELCIKELLDKVESLDRENALEPIDTFMRLNYRECVIYAELFLAKHSDDIHKKASAAQAALAQMKYLTEVFKKQEFRNEVNTIHKRIDGFIPTVYSEREEREIPLSLFEAEISEMQNQEDPMLAALIEQSQQVQASVKTVKEGSEGIEGKPS